MYLYHQSCEAKAAEVADLLLLPIVYNQISANVLCYILAFI